MKKIFLALFIATASMIFMSSCKKQSLSDDQIQKDIVGSWTGSYNTGDEVGLERSNTFEKAKQTIIFNDDNTFTIKRDDSVYVENQPFTIKNSTIHFEYENVFVSEFNDIYLDVYHLKGKKMILQDPDTGKKYHYKKD